MALGIILAPAGYVPGSFPYAIAQSRGARQSYLGPVDPQWYTSGEQGYYYDTPLGAPKWSWLDKLKAKWQARKMRLGFGSVPSDFELATGCRMPYTPVNTGWIAAKEGYFTPPWNPPNGDQYAGPPGSVYTPGWPSGLHEAIPAATTVTTSPASVEDVLAVMNAHNDRTFALAIVSTTAVAVSALVTLMRTLKLQKDEAR